MNKNEHTDEDFNPDVIFDGEVCKTGYCMCDGCHWIGKGVLKFRYPETLYFDGKHLTTRYHKMWLCRSCAEKLKETLERAEWE